MAQNYNRTVQIVLFFIISVLFFVSISAYSSYVTPFAQGQGMTPAQIGVILGATGMISMFIRFPIGIFAQLFSKRKLVCGLGLFITVVAWLTAFFMPNYATLFIAKGVGGITGATWVMYTVLFSTYFTEEEIPGSIGVINLASSIGPIIGATVGGAAAELFDFEYSFIVAVIAAALGIVLLFFLKEPETNPASTPAETWEIAKEQVKDKNVWRIGILATLPMMATYAFMDYLTPTIVGDLGGGAAEIAITANCFRISCIVASPLVGFFFYKVLGVEWTVGIGAVGLGLACIIMPHAPGLVLVYILHCAIGFFFTMNFTMLLSLIIMGVPKKYQTTRMGFLQSFYCIGLWIGPMGSGFITQALSITHCAYIMGGAVLLIALLTKPLVPKELVKLKKLAAEQAEKSENSK